MYFEIDVNCVKMGRNDAWPTVYKVMSWLLWDDDDDDIKIVAKIGIECGVVDFWWQWKVGKGQKWTKKTIEVGFRA